MPSETNNIDNNALAMDEAFEWLMRIQAAPADVALRADLEIWLAADEAHRDAYRSVERMWSLSAGLPREDAGHSGVALFPTTRAARRSGVRRAATVIAGALAACLILTAAPTLRLHMQADYMTGTGEIRQVALKDGSVVHLDTGSAIAVRYGPAIREVVLLSGQAFFTVEKARDRPFLVVAGDVRTTVTGTAFAVRSTAGLVTVSLQSGSVDVVLGNEEKRIGRLTPGDRLIVDRANGRFAKTRIATEDIAAWRDRRLVVHGATLADVVAELDRYHKGLFVLRDLTLAGRRVTGTFDLGRPVEALQAAVGTQKAKVTELTPYLAFVTGP